MWGEICEEGNISVVSCMEEGRVGGRRKRGILRLGRKGAREKTRLHDKEIKTN